MCSLQATSNENQRLLATQRGQLAGTLSQKRPESQEQKELMLRDWPAPSLGYACADILRTYGPFAIFKIVTIAGGTQIVQHIVDKPGQILVNLPLLARLAQRDAEFWTRLYLLPERTQTWRLGSVDVHGALYSLHRLEIFLNQLR